MELVKDKQYGGERPLFGSHDMRLDNITIVDGESGIKCCKNLECVNSKFYGKYPWWHVDGSVIEDCYFAPGSRSAIWYSNDMVMRNCVIDGQGRNTLSDGYEQDEVRGDGRSEVPCGVQRRRNIARGVQLDGDAALQWRAGCRSGGHEAGQGYA